MDKTHAFSDSPCPQGIPCNYPHQIIKNIEKLTIKYLASLLGFKCIPLLGRPKNITPFASIKASPIFPRLKDGLCKTGGSPCLDSSKSHDLTLSYILFRLAFFLGFLNPKRGVFLDIGEKT